MAATEKAGRVVAEEAASAPLFRRARPSDAVDVALETFLSEARVDMQTLAGQLGVAPATVYRWFGSRAELLDSVCERLAEQFATAARAEARGDGAERVCDYARRMMQASVPYPPVRAFVAREPQLALRLLLGKDGSVHRVLVEHTRALIAETRRSDEPPLPDERVHLIVQVATGLVWATFVIGEEPHIDSAVEVIRMVLSG
jgi:AcrR family transcriptional regulator